MAVDGLRQALSERYAIERELGRGGMATVYLATDTKVARQVAIKVLHPELTAALGGERFHREIQIATHLTHPNILPVHDSGEAEGTLYYVMPYVEGESLRDRLDREHQLSIEEAVRITCQIAGALEYAHRANIIHRDIKPENILLESGQAVLADFGIARAVTSAADAEALTRTGMSLGTPTYMSPEQAMGERNLDGRSDQYALACVAYEMLAGQPPFTAKTQQAMIARHLSEQVPLITTVRRAVPDPVQDVILQALEKVPADRFPSVGMFAEALADAASLTLGMTSTRNRMTAQRAMRYSRSSLVAGGQAVDGGRRNRVVVMGLAAGVLLAGVGTWVAAGLKSDKQASVAGGAIADAFDPRKIAVMYFEGGARDGQLSFLAEALTHSLIEELDQVDGLDVVSAGGVRPFKDVAVRPDSVARVLNVGTLVQGSVEPQGDRVRLTVRLIEGASGADFRRGSFELPRRNLLAVRDSLVRAVASFLRRRVGEEVRLRTLKESARNADAWALVQRADKARADAEAALAAKGPGIVAESLRVADSLLARAEQLDPQWVAPVVGRGVVAFRRSRLEADPHRAAPWLDAASTQVERALARAPKDPDALELRGTVALHRVGRGLVPNEAESRRVLDRAEADLRAATSVDRNQATAWDALSRVLYLKMNKPGSYLAAEKAYEADAYLAAAPTIVWRLFSTSYDLEEFPQATRWCTEGRRRFPKDPQFVRCRLFLYTMGPQKPDPAAAWRLVDSLASLTPKHELEYRRREAQLLVAATLARAGLADSARRVIQRSRATSEIDPRGELVGYEAFAMTFLGDRDGAIDLIERYLTDHPDHRAGWGKVNNWWWRDLQSHPRYRQLSNLSR